MGKNTKTANVSRRELLGAAAMGVAVPYFIPSGVLAAPGRVGPNDKINVALIGANGQGNYDLAEVLQYPDVVATAVCDVAEARRNKTIADKCKDAKGYNDYREVLARKDIDAVIIASSPHWHAKMCVDAAEAGKDFYCEKPMTLHLAESLAVKRAAEKHQRVTQVGTQIHASKNFHKIVDVIRCGALGPISTVRCFHVLNQGKKGIGRAPDTEPPKGVDWDFWLGPAPKRPFNELLFRDSYHHPSFMISGGWTPGMAPHVIDLPFWALELGVPPMTSSAGGRYVIEDCGDAYDFHQVTWQYPKFTLTWWTSLINNYAYNTVLQASTKAVGRRRGIFFHGLKGTLIADYDYLSIWPEGEKVLDDFKPEDAPQSVPDSPGHHREWLDCIRSRSQPSCNVSYHHKLDAAIALSMLSLELGRSIRYDPVAEKIIGDPEAARRARPVYREPWKFPDQYVPEL